jgi:hypothetical protein
MTAISTSNTPSTLAQALTKLASDEAAKAAAKIITADQVEVAQLEKSQTSIQSTGVNVIA